MNDRKKDIEYEPKNEFVLELLKIRQEYIDQGGRLYTADEIVEELSREKEVNERSEGGSGD